jgi:DNA-directed RNA polymerase I and III subunit RPAC1
MVDRSRLVEIHPERVGAVSSPHFPHNLSDGKDYSWSLTSFKKELKTKITRMSDWRIEFDLVGLDASIANAMRRVMLAEVPTVAIEEVFVWNNTSIIVDEVLSHRLGLVPLKVDPDALEYRDTEGATDVNTLVFSLDVSCERVAGTSSNRNDPENIRNAKVLSSAIKWEPKGAQTDMFDKDDLPRPVHNDILLAKLRPGQKIKMELHCVKGVGKDHAKFSPVSTASYRLLPHIHFPDPTAFTSEERDKLVKCFPPGVLGVRKHKVTGVEEVFVKSARKDTVSREVLRYKEFDGKVVLGRVRDHFLFDVESTGAMKPETILPASIKVLRDKIKHVRRAVEVLENRHGYST